MTVHKCRTHFKCGAVGVKGKYCITDGLYAILYNTILKA